MNEFQVERAERELNRAIVDIAKKKGGAFLNSYISNETTFGVEQENEIKARAEILKKKSGAIFELSENIIDSTPGFVGDLAQWMTETAKAPQPSLSLGSILTLVGVIKGHRVRSDTNIRTNLFALGIADAGSGKDHTLSFAKKILEQSGLENLISSPPTAGSSIPALLKERKGVAYIPWDEIGHSLEGSLSKRAANYEKSIISELLTVYSSADSTYRSKEYTNKKMNETIIVEEPCLGIWGVTTPRKFYDVLTSANAADGFLPRWLMFPITNPDSENRDVRLIDDVPQVFIDEVLRIRALPSNVDPRGDIDYTIRPKIIEFSKEAKILVNDIRDKLNRLKVAERERGLGLDAVWSRAWVHVVKCALIVTDGDEIGDLELIWAYTLVKESLEGSINSFIANCFDTESGKEIDRVLQLIIKKPGIISSKLLKSSHLKAKDFYLIMATLIETGEVKVIEELNSISRPVKRYYCVKD